MAIGILVFATFDLLVLSVAPVLGWVAVPAEASTWTVVALASAFLLALLAMIGSVSVLATDFPLERSLVWDASCGDCGRMPDRALTFCDHCGA